MLKVVGTAVALLCATGAQALACSVPFIRTFDNQTVDGAMTARTAKPCTIHLRRTTGPMYGARIVERPAHGTASVGAGHRIVYLSRPGYVGRDAFTYARTGLTRHNAGVARAVRVAVIVRP
jgi:hypothetical protein